MDLSGIIWKFQSPPLWMDPVTNDSWNKINSNFIHFWLFQGYGKTTPAGTAQQHQQLVPGERERACSFKCPKFPMVTWHSTSPGIDLELTAVTEKVVSRVISPTNRTCGEPRRESLGSMRNLTKVKEHVRHWFVSFGKIVSKMAGRFLLSKENVESKQIEVVE